MIKLVSVGLFSLQFAFFTAKAQVKPAVDFTNSNLPIVIITTYNEEDIPDDYKVTANMKIIYHGKDSINQLTDTTYNYNGPVGIEIRGSYSASLPQKPYGFETRDTYGNNLNVKLVGLPKDNDWILLANYNDKSFVRNSLAFELFRSMGHYAPRTRHCEVVVNGLYQGIYVLTEKIKINKKRVDIASLDTDDNAGDSLTGGYIFKVDYYENNFFTSRYPKQNGGEVVFNYYDPKYKNMTDEQTAYIESFINSMETTLYGKNYKDPVKGYSSYMNVNSFIDYFIIGELSRNVDAYKKSAYFFKDKDSKSGLLNAGPVWDMDWAYKNFIDCNTGNTDGSGWAWKIHDCDPWPNPPKWTVRLMTDPNFTNQLNNRYFDLRKTILNRDSIFHYIDSVENLLAEAQVRHYTQWPILGQNVGTPEMDNIPTTFDGELVKFKRWISTRLNWLDANWPEYQETDVTDQPVQPGVFSRVFPNPANDRVFVECNHKMSKIEVYNFAGSLLGIFNLNAVYETKVDVKHLPKGIYILKIVTNEGNFMTERLIKTN